MRLGWPARILLLAAVLLPSEAARAAEYYYAMVFVSQSRPKLLRYTHTWATFVRAVGEGPDPNTYWLDVHTISWLPATLDVRVWNPSPEPGVNLTLEQTLGAVRASNQHITMWGPFLISPDIYHRSLGVKQILESGQVEYRAISGPRNLLVSDCIQAVAACDPIFGRDHYPLIRIGKPASRFIAREVVTRSLENRGFDQRTFDNAWLIPRLGLDRYPIEFILPQQIPFRRCFFCRCPP